MRWLASSYRTVSAVWGNYQSLCLHFQKASDPNKCNGRSTFAGILRRMQSPEFLIGLGIMYDALFELSNWSLLLQDRGTSIVYADKLIHRAIQLLETLKEKGGTKTLEAKDAAKKLLYQNIILIENKKLVKINEVQFLTSLINRMYSRLLTTQSSYEKGGGDSRNEYKQDY